MRFEDADKGWMEKRLRRFVVRRWFSGVGSATLVQRRWFSGVGSVAFVQRRWFSGICSAAFAHSDLDGRQWRPGKAQCKALWVVLPRATARFS